jgi:hypothetical protein
LQRHHAAIYLTEAAERRDKKESWKTGTQNGCHRSADAMEQIDFTARIVERDLLPRAHSEGAQLSQPN